MDFTDDAAAAATVGARRPHGGIAALAQTSPTPGMIFLAAQATALREEEDEEEDEDEDEEAEAAAARRRTGEGNADDQPLHLDPAGEHASDGWCSDSDAEFEFGEENEKQLETLIRRLTRHGPEIVTDKTTQKHQDMAALMRCCPRTTKPEVVLRGTVGGLPPTVLLNMSTPGWRAHWSGKMLEPDPPSPETHDFDGTSGTRPRSRKGEGEAEEGAGDLWLGRVKSPSSGVKRKKGSINTASKVAGQKSRSGARKKVGEATKGDPAKSTEKRRMNARLRRSYGAGKYAESALQMNAVEVEESVRKQQARQLLWAQRVVSGLDNPDAASPSTSHPSASSSCVPNDGSNVTTSVSVLDAKAAHVPAVVKRALAQQRNNVEGIPQINITIKWQARTRVRSGMQPPIVKSTTMEVYPREMVSSFIKRLVHMPPGGSWDDTRLSWGSIVLKPSQVMEDFYYGSWVLNVRSDPPPELMLVVPVGTLLLHPVLCEAAGWRFSIPNKFRAAINVKEDTSNKKDTKGSLASRGASVFQRHPLEVKELKDLSNRALHPGRTDPKGMAAALLKYGVVEENRPCTQDKSDTQATDSFSTILLKE